MTPGELQDVEAFAERQLATAAGHCVVWTSDAGPAAKEAAMRLHLIAEYQALPRRQQRYSFVLTPAALLIARLTTPAAPPATPDPAPPRAPRVAL